MIGILLALYVNNWNEENKERKTQLNNLSELRSEIKTMSEFLKTQKKYLENAKAGSEPLLEIMGSDAKLDISVDSINSLFRKLANTDFVTQEKLLFETKVNYDVFEGDKYKDLIKILSNWKHVAGRIAADFALLEANREQDLEKALIDAGVPGLMLLYNNDKS
ncbi:MAG: DUF6090 family protein, partial [Melioribacteraceae bacterium]|nr:DUF6090 family protein [Melioribacteraceae bacterium]